MLSQPGDHGCGFPGGSVVKNLPASAGDTGSIPGQEDPLEKGMATHSSILEEEKLKFYITSCSFCLCNSACSFQSLDQVGFRKWGLTRLETGAYLTYSCPALCNHPAPANLQTRLIMLVPV